MCYKLAPRYKFITAGANLIHQSKFLVHENAETGFKLFKGWCPFKFKIKVSAAKQLT
jgi:hypothetical protein